MIKNLLIVSFKSIFKVACTASRISSVVLYKNIEKNLQKLNSQQQNYYNTTMTARRHFVADMMI